MSSGAAAQPWRADRRLSRLLDIWHERCGPGGTLPSRLAIDPVTLGPELLPFIALIEAVDAGARFRFRLVGSQLAANAGLNLTGRYVDEVNPNQAYAAYISDLYAKAIQARQPIYSETRYRTAAGRVGLTRRLICPLASDGQAIDMFVAAQSFEADSRFGEAPTYTYADDFVPGDTLIAADLA